MFSKLINFDRQPERNNEFNGLSKRVRNSLGQCFSTTGPRPGAGPWHQLYQAARIFHFNFLSISHEQIFYSINYVLCISIL